MTTFAELYDRVDANPRDHAARIDILTDYPTAWASELRAHLLADVLELDADALVARSLARGITPGEAAARMTCLVWLAGSTQGIESRAWRMAADTLGMPDGIPEELRPMMSSYYEDALVEIVREWHGIR